MIESKIGKQIVSLSPADAMEASQPASKSSDDLASKIVDVVVAAVGWPSDRDCNIPESVVNLAMAKARARLVGPFRM